MWRALTIVLAVALAAALVPLVRHFREAPPPPEPVVRTSFTMPPGVEAGAGDAMLDAAISGDSSRIAFVASRDGQVRLWHRATDAAVAEPLAGTDGAMMPAWKPGNGVIAFFASGALNQVAVSDGAVRRLSAAPAPGGVSWQADGSLLFAPDGSGVIKLLRNGQLTDATRLASSDRAHVFPFAIDGGRFIYVALRTDGTRVVRLSGRGDDVDLTQTSGHAELISDVLVWVRDGVLLAQRIDFDRRVLIGRATALVAREGVAASGRGLFAASRRLVLAAAGGASSRELAWFDASGQRLSTIIEPGDYSQVRLSPDDRRVAVSALDPLLRTLDVFAASLDNPGRLTRLSLSLGADTDPAWSPDSARLGYRSTQRGGSQVLTRALEPATAPEVPLPNAQPNETVTDWRRNELLLQAPSASSGFDVWMLDTASGTRTQVTRGGFNESAATWSPEGSHLALVSDESGQPEVYVVRWPGADGRVRVSFGGGTRPQWGRNGRSLFFMRDSRIMRTTMTVRGAELTFSTPEAVVDAPGLVDFSIAHHSDRFAVLTRASGARSTITEAITGWMSLVPAAPPR